MLGIFGTRVSKIPCIIAPAYRTHTYDFNNPSSPIFSII